MKDYSLFKTAYKTAEPPIFVILAAQAAGRFLGLNDEISTVAAVAIYGIFCGLRNVIKNRKKI